MAHCGRRGGLDTCSPLSRLTRHQKVYLGSAHPDRQPVNYTRQGSSMQTNHIVLRPEVASDAEAISHVHMDAFKTHPVSNQTEHLIIKKMRERHDLTVSLVATLDSTVVGHIAFSKITVGGLSSNWHLLGPLAVSPVHQRHGIGSQLVLQGLEELQSLKPDGCLLYGDPDYYHRLGFSPSDRFHHDGIPSHMLLAITYAQTDSHGAIQFHPAFYAPA